MVISTEATDLPEGSDTVPSSAARPVSDCAISPKAVANNTNSNLFCMEAPSEGVKNSSQASSGVLIFDFNHVTVCVGIRRRNYLNAVRLEFGIDCRSGEVKTGFGPVQNISFTWTHILRTPLPVKSRFRKRPCGVPFTLMGGTWRNCG